MQSEVLVKGGEHSLVAEKIITAVPETAQQNEVQIVLCVCCGMSEDCTPTYITRIKDTFSGKWVCGLCSEAIKEQIKRKPATTPCEAMQNHMSFCAMFNRTTRLNPKLSLASSMRDIARKSSTHRTTNDESASKVSGAISCRPGLDIDMHKLFLQ